MFSVTCTAYLHLKPSPGGVHLAQVLFDKGEGRQALLSRTEQPHTLGVYAEVVGAHLHM